MIKTRKQYKEYVHCDLVATGIYKQNLISWITDRRRKFYKSLRKTEFYFNTSTNIFRKIYAKLLIIRHEFLCNKYGWTIPINVIDKGLAIVHVGTIVISSKAKIGEYCRIHVDVNIGSSWIKGKSGAPVIGNYVYIGPGSKIFGPIHIGDKVVIGANSVVNKSFIEGNYTIAGVPAKIVSNGNSDLYIKSIVENH